MMLDRFRSSMKDHAMWLNRCFLGFVARGRCRWLLPVLIVLTASASLHRSAPARPTHLVLIVSDSLRWDALGCNGGAARTPNLDWLARQGTSFDNVHSTAACTMPSSVALLTGNHSSTYGVRSGRPQPGSTAEYTYFVPEAEALPAERLAARGFTCAMSMENGLAFCSNNTQGFAALGTHSTMSTEQIARVEGICGIRNKGWAADFNISCKYDLMYPLLATILDAPADRPLFLLKWFFAPHVPYTSPPEFHEKLAPIAEKLGKSITAYTRTNYIQLGKLSEVEKVTVAKPLYLASVEAMDERVGYILTALHARGMLERTLIVFTSDHGEYFGEHGLYGHEQAFFEPVLHVPLLMAGPGIPAGRREKAAISQVDLMPTLVELFDVGPGDMQGRSFAPLLRGAALPDRPVYFDGLNNPQLSQLSDGVLFKGVKLIADRRGSTTPVTLYDLPDDPAETRPLPPGDHRRSLLWKQLHDIRRANRKRLSHTLDLLRRTPGSPIDWSVQRKLLQSLGYIQ